MKPICFFILFAMGMTTVAFSQTKMTMRKISIPAKPNAIEIDPAHTAVIVVDMQNDFGSKDGMFDRAGIDISGIRKAVEVTSGVLEAARTTGIPIVYLKMGYSPDLSDLGAPESTNRINHLRIGVGETITAPDGSKSRILIRDTWNTDIVAELKPKAADHVIYKTRYSGFFKTDLDNLLQKLGVKSIIFTGCTTSVCVESTVRDAMFRDYVCLVLEDCTAEPIGNNFPRSNHEASLLLIQMTLGKVSSSEQLIKSLKQEAIATH